LTETKEKEMHKDEEETERALRTALDPNVISERNGLSYVTGRYVKDTLNDAFGHLGWSYRVEQFEILGPAKAFARVSLTVLTDRYNITREAVAVGYGSETTASGEPLSEARANEVLDFACAEAVTDALKRAACSFGPALGLHLYPLLGKGTQKKNENRKRQAVAKEDQEVQDEW
jgi:recombination DNA repair RAD52 pathway protein